MSTSFLKSFFIIRSLCIVVGIYVEAGVCTAIAGTYAAIFMYDRTWRDQ